MSSVLCPWFPQALSVLNSNSFKNPFPVSLYIVKMVKSIAEECETGTGLPEGFLPFCPSQELPADGKPQPLGWDEQIPSTL